MKCRVLRPFSGLGGHRFSIGEKVDTTDWKNREQLIAQRYIQPARLSSGFEKKSTEVAEEPYQPPPPPKKKVKRVLAEV